MEVRFLYSVNPKKPIKTIKTIPVLRAPKSLQLTKEEVRECLKYGSVYRRFANEGRNERVTINNVDRLHNAKFMTEDEYAAFLKANIDSKTGTVINNVAVVKEEPIVNNNVTVDEVVEAEKELSVEEDTVTDDNNDEEKNNTETVELNYEKSHNNYRNYNNKKNYKK